MFIHLEMRKTMSQEPFDFSSTAESDFAPSHAYVSKKTKKEDVTSTAYTFTIVSVAGFILLILFGLDLLPFHSASYTKTLILIVIGFSFIKVSFIRDCLRCFFSCHKTDRIFSEAKGFIKLFSLFRDQHSQQGTVCVFCRNRL